MSVVTIALQALVAIASVLLVLFVLLHRGRGGGMSDLFGGAASSAGSSGVAEKNLNRITIATAGVWVLGIAALGMITKFSGV